MEHLIRMERLGHGVRYDRIRKDFSVRHAHELAVALLRGRHVRNAVSRAHLFDQPRVDGLHVEAE
ncbi:hypothetical protein SDC9_90235 [bioreactor metagenome]|uniref:Uncharacterized protein n=1 Tax=bioreactor metagenome TaxID=1076179 RepID=A0A644ZT39_9ZZZZ